MELLETRDCLCLASRRAARTITRAFDRALRPHGLRATQFSLLSVLALKGPLAITAIARAIDVERTTLTRNIRLLEQRGLVRSLTGKDARTRLLEITDEGQDLLTRALADWKSVQSRLTQDIGLTGANGLRRLAGPLKFPATA